MTAPEDPTDEHDPERSDDAGRRPGARRDPAAMRETLDAARRRLGPATPTDGPPQSAATQRALLREAVANQSVPLAAGPPHPPGAGPGDPAHDETDAGPGPRVDEPED